MHAREQGDRTATVYVAEKQREELQRIAERSTAYGASILREELERALVIKADEAPRAFVRLNSVVEYEDLISGRTRTVVIVAPNEADIDEDRISVLTPVGAALLGLVAGESFSWVMEDGRPRALVVRRVVNHHE